MKHISLIFAFSILFLAWNTTFGSGIPCSSDYETAVAFLNDAPIGQGNKTKLLSHIQNAWRKYTPGKKNSKKNALNELRTALQLLDSKATKQIPPEVKNEIRLNIQTLSDCMSGSLPPETATLTIRTFLPSDESIDGIAGPAPAGGLVYIDGVEFGVTGVDGTATFQVPARTLEVVVRLYPSNAGETTLTLLPDETKQVDIILADGKEIADDSTLVIDQIQNDILDRNFTALTLRFVKDTNTTVLLNRVDFVSLVDPNGGASIFVTQMFTLQPDGSLILNDVNAFRNLLLARSGKILLNVHGEDMIGRTQDRTAEFFISAYKVVGRIAAPPSNPGLNLAGVFITGTILNTNLFFNVVTDGAGNFEFPLLPVGNFEFNSETIQNNLYYYGQGTIVLNGNKSLTINMLNTTDLVNGVPPFVVTVLPGLTEGVSKSESILNKEEALFAERYLLAEQNKKYQSLLSGEFEPVAESETVSVSVTAGAQNVPINQTATLNVPQGTKTVTLTYLIQTDEYPTYVLANSIYNDTWSLAVRAGGSGQALIPPLSRQINSQLTVEPVWQSNGTTGQIKKIIDVQALTANAPTTVVLFASAMNVGDGILPTRVQASLGVDSGVKINSITGDNSVPLNFHSIPRPDAVNTFDRIFTLKITKPETATVTKITGTLLIGSQMIVVDEAPGGSNVQIVDAETLKVRVSMHSPTVSTISSQPPPTHKFKYKFKLFVNDNGTEVTDEKESGERRALWRMPDGFNRYGSRDNGGDNWSSRGTYNWLSANSGLITRIDDISGEHGRNIGHQTHKYGTDIDMYHFYTFPGAVSGGDNYAKLTADVKLAININSPDPVIQAQALAAKQRVTDWVTASRNGLTALANNSTVIELRYALGSATTGLSAGWARDLLKTGITTVSGQTLDLGTGVWNNSKYIPVGDHDHHVHITLSRPALSEAN